MKILTAMSGGVDSSAAAMLLKNEGNECIGCTMKLFSNEDAGLERSRGCCSLEDVEDAAAVCRRLGMRHYVFNFSDVFRKTVMEPFAAAYCEGCTPNPCIDCNRFLKFGKLLERAAVLGCSHVATGHYARIGRQDGRFVLKRALDETKDQSYVLYAMDQQQLAHTRFPLGELTKAQVRRMAAQAGFVNADKPDSQDICFAPDGDYAAAIARITGRPAQPGDFVGMDGRPLGRHRGIVHYTVGQHRGLGLSLPERRYVCAIRPEDDTVVLGPEAALYRRTVLVPAFHWISGEAPAQPVRGQAKLRYRQPAQPVLAQPLDEGAVLLCFDTAQRAVTPGQAAVLYDGDVVLGGGVIGREQPPE